MASETTQTTRRPNWRSWRFSTRGRSIFTLCTYRPSNAVVLRTCPFPLQTIAPNPAHTINLLPPELGEGTRFCCPTFAAPSLRSSNCCRTPNKRRRRPKSVQERPACERRGRRRQCARGWQKLHNKNNCCTPAAPYRRLCRHPSCITTCVGLQRTRNRHHIINRRTTDEAADSGATTAAPRPRARAR